MSRSNIPPGFMGILEKSAKLLAYAVVALEVIEFAKDKIEQVKQGDYKPVNAVSNEHE